MALPFKNILIFEDELARSRRFLPLTYTRCLAELRSGCMTGLERTRIAAPDTRIYLHAVERLKPLIKKRYGLHINEIPVGQTLLINARGSFHFDGSDSTDIVDELPSEIAKNILAGEPVGVPRYTSDSRIMALWDIAHQNSDLIVRDIALLHSRGFLERVDPDSLQFAATRNPSQLFVHPSAKIDFGVVFDCSAGPILIEESAHIMSHVTIVGPAVIGKGSIVKIGAKVYGGTTIGPVCKVGGEIESSIVQGYSNKQHDGYLGHSYLGEWVNLGAGTNTSDLKNDYSTVRMTIEDEEFDTKSLFTGLLMGDHSKSAINTRFNTGTAVGVSCNIFSADFPPKWVPSFSWVGSQGITMYRYEKAAEVAKTVMARRNMTLSVEEEKLLRTLFEEKGSIEV